MSTPPNAARAQVNAWIARGHEEQLAGRPEAAVPWFRRALDRDPSNFDALQLLGLSRIHAGQVEDGIALLRRALAVKGGDAGVHNNLGNALLMLGRRAEAVESLRRAFALAPSNANVGLNFANAQRDLGDLAGSITTLVALLQHQPRCTQAHFALALCLRALGRPRDALVALERALALDPADAHAHVQRGLALVDLGDPVSAHQSMSTATRLAPEDLRHWMTLLEACVGLDIADWSAWPQACASVRADAAGQREVIDPMRAMLLPATDTELAALTARFVRSTVVPGAPRPAPRPARPTADRRIRLGYLSPDFGDHPVGRLVTPLLREHDRARFSVTAYGWGTGAGTVHRAHTASAVDRFLDVSHVDDARLAEQLRADGIDIAIDLAGYTGLNRIGVLLERPAPVQIGWLGYPGTLGCHALDYLIADGTSIPPEATPAFSEQVVRLPGCALPFDPDTPIAPAPLRSAFGLPDEAIVLACFATTRKLNPLLFDVWMDALKGSPAAVLWLAASSPAAAANLSRAAAARGVDPARVVIAPRAPNQAEYLARYRVADLALDTFPYGSHSTALDVLWAGCPLLALSGPSMPSRVSSAILRTAGLEDLISSGLDAYGYEIRRLAADRAALQALRARVERARAESPLFDLPGFARHLEAAYTQMHARAQAGLPPDAFNVA